MSIITQEALSWDTKSVRTSITTSATWSAGASPERWRFTAGQSGPSRMSASPQRRSSAPNVSSATTSRSYMRSGTSSRRYSSRSPTRSCAASSTWQRAASPTSPGLDSRPSFSARPYITLRNSSLKSSTLAALGLPGAQASAAADWARKSRSSSFIPSSLVGMPTSTDNWRTASMAFL